MTKNKKGKIFKKIDEAYDHFSKILHNNDILMVKGSNATGLNKFLWINPLFITIYIAYSRRHR